MTPKNQMGIVLPDGILGNSCLEYVRYWIMANCQVLASVDLPVEMIPDTQSEVVIIHYRFCEWTWRGVNSWDRLIKAEI
jgi:hypothetical protein